MRWVNAKPRSLYARKRPGTRCMGGWVGGRVGLDACRNLAHTRIRSPDRPARSESLYRLSYPGLFALMDIRIKSLYITYIRKYNEHIVLLLVFWNNCFRPKSMLQYLVRTHASVTVKITCYVVTEQRPNPISCQYLNPTIRKTNTNVIHHSL